MENSSIMNSTMGDLGSYFVPQKYYDPNSSARVCCIELPNNSQLIVQYTEKCTIKELVEKVINSREFRINSYKRAYVLDAKNHINMYDLHLCLYRQIKPDYENKISYDIKVDLLHEKGFIKNSKYPFFIFKDNKTPFSFTSNSNQIKSDLLRNIIESEFDGNALYSLYLPRINTIYKLNYFPELEDFFTRNKKCYNEFNHFNLNPLLNDHDRLDWFIYDNESMNFLINMNKTNIEVQSKLKLIHDKLYFEDIYEEENSYLTEKDIEKFFVNLYVEISNPNGESQKDLIQQKVKITMNTTGFDLLEKMNKKIRAMQSDLVYDSKKMILKVRSLNDYIFDLTKPVVLYSYISECVKHNKEADYIILKNPIYDPKENNNENQIQNENDVNVTTMQYSQNMTCIHYPFDNLLSLAVYNPMINNNNSDIGNPNISLSKSPKVLSKEENLPEDNLDLFINSLTKDIADKTRKDYDDSLNNIGDEDLSMLKDPMLEKYEIKDVNELKESSMNNTTINLNNTTMLTSNSTFIGGPVIRKKKTKNFVETPNVFMSDYQTLEEKDCKDLSQIQLSSINIRDVDRPFSILLKSAYIKDLLNSTPFERHITSIFQFRMQLFLGSKPFSQIYRVTWKNSTKDLNPELNKRIYFDLNYSQIPNFCSILFKVKFIQYNEEGEIMGNSTKYWGNFRLFDHNLRLKCGMHKINLYSGLFTDDAYYYFTDNDEEDKCSKIYFEIEHFNKSVFNKITHITNFSFDINSVMVNEADKNKIDSIKKRSPFEEMTNYDKEVLWSNRFKLSSEPEMLSKVLSCIDYSNPKHLIELEKILEIAKNLNSVNSMGLLGGKFLHESIRNFAVKCLKNSPLIEIQEYLYELVHGLRYEINHDNELVRFLIEKAVKYPVTLGHSFYWILKSQMYEQNFQQRYGLYLEIFLNKIGPTLTKIFFDEESLLYKLEEICEEQKNKKLGKKEKLTSFNELIQTFNETLEKEQNEISLPLNFKYRINKIDAETCKVLTRDGKHIELELNMKNVDPLGENFIINYYNDQDIRMSLVTMELFNILRTIWIENNLNLKMSLYDVMPTGRNKGIIKLIPDSQVFDDMPIKEKAGHKNLFGKRSLRKYLTLNSGISAEEFYDNFITSNVAYCVANYVLGVTQRTKKNLNMKKNGEIYYTSYEHLLNHYSKILGDRGIPFFFNITFVDFLSEKEENFKTFKELYMKAYLILRNKSKDLIEVLEIMLSSGLPEISQKSLQYLEDTLALNKTEDDAKELINNVLSYIMSK